MKDKHKDYTNRGTQRETKVQIIAQKINEKVIVVTHIGGHGLADSIPTQEVIKEEIAGRSTNEKDIM